MALATLFILTAARAVMIAQAPAPVPATRTAWDGVYTDAQAKRGAVIFSQSCAGCHVTGTEGTRPVVGDKFWQNFTQKSVADLVAFLKTSMPNGSPGSLPAASYNDLTAFILQANGFPTGTMEVVPESGVGVQIVPKDGSGELPANTLARVVGCLAAKSGSDWTLTRATAPERIDRGGPAAGDATRPLGDRTVALKFVVTRLDQYVGQRLAVSGLLLGAGGKDGINVTDVTRVGDSCN